MARAAIASIRQQMPDARIVHMTTGEPMPEADEAVSVAVTGHVWIRRAIVQAHAPLPMLSLDVDIVMRRDVSELWDLACDVALPRISDPHVRCTGGVWFCRSRAFLDCWAGKVRNFNPNDSRQLLAGLSAYAEEWTGAVHWLAESIYERLPKGANDACDGAALVHYRGRRKAWMSQ